MEDQENQVVIEEPVEVVQEEVDITVLPKEEQELIEKHGLLPKEEAGEEDGEHKEQSKVETEENKAEEVEGEEEVNPDPDNFEAMDKVFEKDEDKFHKTYSSNQKALYYKSKRYKERAQEAETQLEELKAGSELQQIKETVSAKKLKAIEEALGSDNLTVEQLQAIIAGNLPQVNEEEKRYTKDEIEALQREEQTKQAEAQKKYQARLALAEQIGKSKYDNFDDLANLAQEVVAQDTTGTYQKILSETFNNTSIDEETVVEKVLTIAQLNPKFKETVSSASPSDKENVSRAIKNSKKSKSSASVTGSKNRRVVNHDDLTINDIASMSTKEYMNIPKKVRDRILYEAN